MKKAPVLLVFLLLLPDLSFAQKFKEWFRQKKTQKEYLIEQIAYLKLYLELTAKGYKIAKEGLTTIGDIKRGEFKLHKNHFDSLLIVSPQVQKYAGVKYVPYFRAEVQKVVEIAITAVKQSETFTEQELGYLADTFKKLMTDCALLVESYHQILKDENLGMSDDQRLERINALYEQMLDNYKFARAFGNEAMILASSRVKEKEDVLAARVLHGLN